MKTHEIKLRIDPYYTLAVTHVRYISEADVTIKLPPPLALAQAGFPGAFVAAATSADPPAV